MLFPLQRWVLSLLCLLPLPAGGALRWAGGDGSLQPPYPRMLYDHVRMPASNDCSDPANFAALQLLLGMLC
jgi:hypothetical protein